MRALNLAYMFVVPLALVFFLKSKNTAPLKRKLNIKILSLLLILMPFIQNVYSQWFTQTSGTSSNIVSVYFINTTTGWAAGENGYVARTTNGGANWVQQTTPTSNVLISIIFTDASTGYISGSFGTIIKTTNGGTNWVALTTGVSGALRVHFINLATGWAVGATGIILKTTNGGTNWSFQSSGSSNFLLEVTFISENTGWVCGQSGVMLNTTNGGTNWTTQTTGSTQNLLGLFFINSLTGWTTGFNGNIYYTTNGGTNWSAQSAGTTDDIYSAYFVNPNTGWISGDNGKIYITQNAGANWSQQTTSTTETFNSIFFSGQQTGWAVGSTGKIMATTSGGVSIPTAPILSFPANNSTGVSLTPSLQWFSVIGAQTYHLVLSTDSLFSTTIIINDSTLTNTSYTVPNGLLQNNMRYYWRIRAKGTSGYGPNSSRWSFTTGMVGVTQTGNEIPNEFKLYNNYPNPFNPSTRIKFDVPVQSFVKIIVYDIAGKEVNILVNENLNMGKYEYEFNASRLSSGVYFYKIVTGGFTDIKKMVLVK